MVSLKFHCQSSREDFIEIEVIESENLIIYMTQDGSKNAVNLNRATAIKLSKELRKQIALLD